MEDRKQIIKALREKGYTYQRIGDILGVSRQRIHSIFTGYSSPSNKSQPTTCVPIDWFPGEVQTKGLWKDGMGGRDYLAEIVRNRDNYTCQICGKVWKEGERRLDVHHLDEERESVLTCENYKKFDRMITLCHKCNTNLKQVRRKMVVGLSVSEKNQNRINKIKIKTKQ